VIENYVNSSVRFFIHLNSGSKFIMDVKIFIVMTKTVLEVRKINIVYRSRENKINNKMKI